MEVPPSESVKQKAEALESLISGPLTSAVSRLLSRSRGIPSGRDFHFYNNFDEFKLPAREIASKAESSLGGIASSTSLWGNKKPPPLPNELDEAYDWLVNLNDDFLEKFGVSMDDFRSFRENQERNGETVDSGDGFQLVCGKKKKRGVVQNKERVEGFSSSSGIKMVSRDKKTTVARAKVPFHLPNIPKPQTEYNILVNNMNTPFEHVWLERSEDNSRFLHPLEKLSVVDFIDRDIVEDEIRKPLSLESTPFKLVEGVKELKELAAKLCEVNEFAVDLEHNQYRSFLGLTCLMQISTRTEDFIVDTLKLRVHIGPYLREAFKDPSKRKVMHGADRDVLWLERDFGIYVCNLFDTGQGSRLLQLERNSLEYLLRHFCDVEANKEYQNADWRLRPLPDEMIKYAREDTHYLLHIYDLMRHRLLSLSSDGNDLLLEVYKRSSEVCLQFYEKEVLTDTSYLHIYGLSEADFDSKQLAIVAGLCEWRDKVAREEDESTGYILPNKALLEIARQMPQSSGNLRRLVKSKHQYVECHLNAVLKIIKNAMANSSAFESIAEEIRKGRVEALALQISEAENSKSVSPTEHAMDCTAPEVDGKSSNKLHTFLGTGNAMPTNMNESLDQIASVGRFQEDKKIPELSLVEISHSSSIGDSVGTVKRESLDNGAASFSQLTKDVTPTASVQVMKKPACAFGALFGNSSRRKTKPLKGNDSEQEKNENKVEQIKSSVILPFYSFSSEDNIPETTVLTDNNAAPPQTVQSPEQQSKTTTMEEIIPLENITNGSESPTDSPEINDGINGDAESSKSDSDTAETNVSLSELSSGFQQCSQFAHERTSQLSPFDYATARKTMKFGEEIGDEEDDGMIDGVLPASRGKKKGFLSSRSNGEQRERGQQPRRRQAFPLSGNRSTTYRC